MKYVYTEKPAFNPETEICSPDYRIENDTFISGWKVEPKPDEDGYIPTEKENAPCNPTLRERVAELEKQNTMLQECLLEVSEIIYA